MTEWNGLLAVGGYFEMAGAEYVQNVALWNGTFWQELDGGFDAPPTALYGGEGALVAGGPFDMAGGDSVVGVARYDHTAQWHAMGELWGAPMDFNYHLGSLYSCGQFDYYYDPYLHFYILGRWTGTEWVPEPWTNWGEAYEPYSMDGFLGSLFLGGYIPHQLLEYDGNQISGCSSGINGSVSSVQYYQNSLFVGGNFTEACGTVTQDLAIMVADRTFHACHEPDVNRDVVDLTVMNDQLYVAGEHHVWRYGSSSWSQPLGGEFAGYIFCMEARNPGELFVGGFPDFVVRWDDDEWVQVGGGLGQLGYNFWKVNCLVNYDGEVVAGGEFDIPRILTSDVYGNIARWDGDAWHRLGEGFGREVQDLVIYQGDLIAGGEFFDPVGDGIDRIARWDGETWHELGQADNNINALAVYQGQLITTGSFQEIGGVSATRIAAHNGATWQPLGSGLDLPALALQEFNGNLIAGGYFQQAGGVAAERIARWTGSVWEPMGDGFDGRVVALAVWQGELYAGGFFTASGSQSVSNLARWDGSTWQPVGGGVTGSDPIYGVTALLPTATELFVGGGFDTAGGVPAHGLATWDGATWVEWGGGVHEGNNGNFRVFDLLVKDGNLYVGGDFTRVSNAVPSYNIALWYDGTLTPTFLQTFNTRLLDTGGRPKVEIRWSVTAAAEVTDFRLSARSQYDEWSVHHIPGEGEGQFTAVDESSRLVGARQVTYVIEYHTADGAWSEIGRQEVFLTPDPIVPMLTVHPNPFNPQTRIRFTIDRSYVVQLAVYAMTGRRVATLASGPLPAGEHVYSWNGRDTTGRSVASGTYLIRLLTESGVQSQKVMLVR